MWKVTLKGLARAQAALPPHRRSPSSSASRSCPARSCSPSTISQTFDDLFAEIYAGTDVQVRGIETVSDSFGGSAPRPTRVRGRTGSRARRRRCGRRQSGRRRPVRADRRRRRRRDRWRRRARRRSGSRWEDDPDLNPVPARAGQRGHRNATTRSSSTRARPTRATSRSATGCRCSRARPPRTYTIVGIAKFGTADSRARRVDRAVHVAGSATHRRVHRRAVQQHRGRRRGRRFARRSCATASPSRPRPTTSRSSPAPSSRRRTRTTSTSSWTSSTASCSCSPRSRSFVSCFIIYNTFTIVVAQRTREMALLRAIGASDAPGDDVDPRSKRSWSAWSPPRSGSALGILLASGLKALLDAVGFDIPAGRIVIPMVAVVGVVRRRHDRHRRLRGRPRAQGVARPADRRHARRRARTPQGLRPPAS